MTAFNGWVLLATILGAADAPPASPLPRGELPQAVLAEWRFDRDTAGWTAEHDCTLTAADGLLRVTSSGNDPYFHRKVDLPGGRMILQMTVRCRGAGSGQVFWTTDRAPHRGEDKQARFELRHDGQWRECTVSFIAEGRLRDLRLDPGGGPGEIEFKSLRLVQAELHPLEIVRVETRADSVRFDVRNHSAAAIAFACGGKSYSAPAQGNVAVDMPLGQRRPLMPVVAELKAEGLPPIRRVVWAVEPAAESDWIEAPALPQLPAPAPPSPAVSALVAGDGSMAKLVVGGQPVAVIAPLVHFDGVLPKLALRRQASGVAFQAEGLRGEIARRGNEVRVWLESQRPCEGPVVRALGRMEQAVFAGLEYLENGEASSSKLDVETPEHVRFMPDPLKVTLPLMAVATDRAAVAVSWDLPGEAGNPWQAWDLQPVFATPNVFDGAADHRMAIRGKACEVAIRVGRKGEIIEESVLWAVARRGLPPLPQPPRSWDEQKQLCLAGLNGPLKTADGWGHCVEDHWKRQPFADIASTHWRLTGEPPALPRLVPNGSHVPNEAIYFVTGRAEQWLQMRTQRTKHLAAQQRADGSYGHDGPMRRGHFEDTAVGLCARPAAELLDFARATGDEEALRAGLRAVECMRRFRTPRGAQVWEIPLHTPDQLASAYAVWACVRAYELTGRPEHLTEARRWALSGVPFVYLWQRHPVMLYGTPPVFGATHWKAPCWIGLPVQWVGGVYAYALTMLAPHDKSLDWNHLARGILIAAEQMQYTEGPHRGLLPDSFDLATQQRRPWDINPCAVVSLRLALDGQLDALAVASDGKHRVVAPFPVVLRDGKAHIRGRAGTEYQALIDGKRAVKVVSKGDDEVPLVP